MFVADHPPLRTGMVLQFPLLQTLAGALPLGNHTLPATRRLAVRLRDGDRLVIHDDSGEGWIDGDRIVVLVHGMCSSSRAPYVSRVAGKLGRAGLRTVRVDMRGCGESRLLSRGHFHAGASDDVADVVAAVRRLNPLSRITVVGFSLGGNAVLRMAGRIGQAGPDCPDSVIAVAPPADLVWASSNLRQWGNRIYDHWFCWQLKKNLHFRRRNVDGLLDNGLVRLPSRLVHFDDQFTAPVCGFSGAREYYQSASAAPLLHAIRIPTLIVAAEDDPVVPCGMFRAWPRSEQVELITTRHGGHLGFQSVNRKDPDRHWLDWRLLHWIQTLDQPRERSAQSWRPNLHPHPDASTR